MKAQQITTLLHFFSFLVILQTFLLSKSLHIFHMFQILNTGLLSPVRLQVPTEGYTIDKVMIVLRPAGILPISITAFYARACTEAGNLSKHNIQTQYVTIIRNIL